jgi:hypothetical protein
MEFPPKQEFRDWLRDKAPDEAVAPPFYGSCECPLANWLTERTGWQATVTPSQTGGHYLLTNNPNFGALPIWANRFAQAAYRGQMPDPLAQLLDILNGETPMQNETWFKLFESAYNDGIERGFSPDEASELAEHLATTGLRSLYADRADRAKDLAKERGEWPPRSAK